MKTSLALFTLAFSLFVAGHAGAESWTRQLTPKKSDDNFSIQVARVKDADVGEVLQFRVTVKLKEIKELPQRSRVLKVFDGKEFISSCEVRPTGPDGERVYSFRVAARYAEKSTFWYTESNNFDHIGYWFYLKDFVDSK